jgi:1-deoxy-D-xylulose-5-phosphate reductoisomerase
MKKVTPQMALNHPTWNMGKRITIDSATLMNKGFEVIEARWLFDMPVEQVSVLVHPQSIVHSMVEYKDGAVIAQLGVTDMRHPIQYALTYPARLATSAHRLDFSRVQTLEFHQPDVDKFPCLELAYQAARHGGFSPCYLNAADEIAVEAFLKGKIHFTQIPEIIARIMNACPRSTRINSIAEVLNEDAVVRRETQKIIEMDYRSPNSSL